MRDSCVMDTTKNMLKNQEWQKEVEAFMGVQ
jgi:hypothetical protein